MTLLNMNADVFVVSDCCRVRPANFLYGRMASIVNRRKNNPKTKSKR